MRRAMASRTADKPSFAIWRNRRKAAMKSDRPETIGGGLVKADKPGGPRKQEKRSR